MRPYPLTFAPKLSPKIWGGRRLERWGKQLPAGAAIGETWEVYDRPEGSAVVESGPLAGAALNDLMKEWGPGLLGRAEFDKAPPRFPLMVKLIDAQDALSVQVHPDDGQALRMVGPEENGKTEMWLVLESEPGAKVTAGLKPGVDQARFSRALKEGKLEEVLNEFEVKPGDAIFIPAGRVHAIGKGCLMAEVQQNSDTTWRVYDYNRLEKGRPRDLHVSQALECIRFDAEMAGMPGLATPKEIPADNARRKELVACRYFVVEQLELEGRFRPGSSGGYHLLMGLSGSSVVRSADSEIEILPGKTVLVPAALDFELSGQASRLLWSRPS